MTKFRTTVKNRGGNANTEVTPPPTPTEKFCTQLANNKNRYVKKIGQHLLQKLNEKQLASRCIVMVVSSYLSIKTRLGGITFNSFCKKIVDFFKSLPGRAVLMAHRIKGCTQGFVKRNLKKLFELLKPAWNALPSIPRMGLFSRKRNNTPGKSGTKRIQAQDKKDAQLQEDVNKATAQMLKDNTLDSLQTQADHQEMVAKAQAAAKRRAQAAAVKRAEAKRRAEVYMLKQS